MRSSVGATRRFYHAFYRYHLLTNIRSCTRTLSTTSPRIDQSNPSDNASPQTARPPHGTRRLNLSAQQTPKSADNADGDGQYHMSKTIKYSPVLTLDEKPFDAFNSWEEVVRYRSETGLLLQIAVPQQSLETIRKVRGQHIEEVQEKTGARIEIGSSMLSNGSEYVSVTLSGSFLEVNRARDIMCANKAAAWLYLPPQSQTDRPSHQLPAWGKVVRESRGEYRKVEVVIPSEQWDIINQQLDLNSLKAKGVEILSFPQRGDGQNYDTSSTQMQSVVLIGSPDDISRARQTLYSLRNRTLRNVKASKTSSQGEPDPRTGTPQAYHYVLLRIPLGPNGEDLARRRLVGARGSTRAEMSRRFGVKNTFIGRDSGRLRIYGHNEENVQKAQKYAQSIVDQACERDGIPALQLVEVSSGITGSQDARSSRASQHERSTGEHAAVLNNTSTTSDVESAKSEQYFVLLKIPKGADGQEVSRKIVGKGGSRLQAILRMYQVRCTIVDSDPSNLRLYGNIESRIREAKAYMQSIVYDTCRLDNIAPMEIEELDSGAVQFSSSTQQAPAIQNAEAHKRTTESAAKGTVDEAHQVSIDDMKAGLRALTHPVVLVTSHVRNKLQTSEPDDLLPFCRGVTVSSFNSVTLEPTPTISFNIRTPSRSWDAISSSRWLNAHILAASPAGAALAHAFTLPYERPDEPFWRARRMGANINVLSKRTGAAFSPSLALQGAIISTMRAKVDLDRCVKVGDHMIVVAEVTQVVFPHPTGGRAAGREFAQDASGLTYAKRGYRGVGDHIEPSAIPETTAESATPLALGTEDYDAADAGTSQPLNEGTENNTSASAVEAELPASEVSNGKTPEQTDIDYFEVIQDDDDDADVDLESVEARSDFEGEEVVQDSAEHDLDSAPIDDGSSPALPKESHPLVDDSAAARDAVIDEAERPGSAMRRSEKDVAQKRPAFEIGNSS